MLIILKENKVKSESDSAFWQNMKKTIDIKTIYLKSKNKKSSTEIAVTKFKDEIKTGPLYIPENKYQVKNSSVFHYEVCSSDRKQCVCLTCHKKLLEGTVPEQALCNSLQVFELPSAFRDIRNLEKIIILKRFLFKYVAIMPKGQFRKSKL